MNRLLSATVFAAAVAVVPLGASAQIKSDVAPPAPAAQPAAQTDVPIRQVVLFSSGVGYFEHFGNVKGDGSTELRFKTDQINDVLKSLVLQDLDKGTVSTVTYPSQEPIGKTLRSFQVDITSNPPLAELLNQLRGAKIDVTLAGGAVEGTIVGVEKHQKSAGDKGAVIDSWVLNIKVGPRFRTVALDDIRDFALKDPKLEEEMDKALAALAGARDQEKKPVTISFRGQGERRVRMGYVVETPIWKTSYRLVMTEAANRAATQPSAKPQATAPGGANVQKDEGGKLQGWAIVENQTDNDWSDVQLSLVSGRPISFIQDLYHPLYVPRPVIFPDLYASLRPQTYQGGISDDEAKKMQDQRAQGFANAPDFNLQSTTDAQRKRAAQGGGAGGGGGLFGGGGGDRGKMKEELPPMDPTQSVLSVASATQLGELFEYTVGNVSLARQRSAMIPIVTDDVEVEKISIYNQTVLETHPLNGARVKNTTKKHLLQGPVTVFEAGGYAGDARIDDVPPGQQRLLSYGIDLNVTADPNLRQDASTVETGKIVKGVMELTRKMVMEQSYVFQNKGDAPRTIIVEHPKEGDWKLIQPTKAEETTDALYRFRTRVDGHKTTTLPVRFERIDLEQIAIINLEADPMQQYIKAGEIPDGVRKALGQVAQMKAKVSETSGEISERKAQIAEVSTEQTRLRENMKTVSPNTEYYNRLLKKLDEQETQIEKLQKENADLLKALEKERKELEAFVVGLNVG